MIINKYYICTHGINKCTPNTDNLTIYGIFNILGLNICIRKYNLLILYDYRYYCNFNILFNLCIQYINGVNYSVSISEYGHPVLNTDTLYTTR